MDGTSDGDSGVSAAAFPTVELVVHCPHNTVDDTPTVAVAAVLVVAVCSVSGGVVRIVGVLIRPWTLAFLRGRKQGF